jgi:hypothetical protein
MGRAKRPRVFGKGFDDSLDGLVLVSSEVGRHLGFDDA